MNFKKILAPILAASCLLVMSPATAQAGQAETEKSLTAQQKLEELDLMCKTLEEKHPNIFTRITKEEFNRERAEVAERLPQTNDFTYVVELQGLVAKIGDSHTTAAMNNAAAEKVQALPFSIKDFEGKWILTQLEQEHAAYLGAELTAIAGHPVAQVEEKLSAFVSHDNDVKAHRQFPYNVYIAQLLDYYGITNGAGDVALTVRTPAGKEETFSVRRYGMADRQQIKWARLSDKRKAVPETEPDTKKNYWFAPLDNKTLYIQFNKCMEDQNLPIEGFNSQLEAELKKGIYSKVAVDLRNNGGGSDGLFVPAIFMLQEYNKKAGTTVYTLIGDTTFSSALTNAVELDVLADAILVGTPTSGSVNHFGSTPDFELPYSGIRVRYSSKYIDLDAFMKSEPLFDPKPTKTYGAAPLMPEVSKPQTLEDYLAGRDTAAEWILSQE